MKYRLRLGTFLPFLMTISLLSACGFHLRGQMDINSEIATLAVSGTDQAYVRQLSKALTNTGIQVTDSAPYRLRVMKVQKETGERTHATAGHYERLLKLSVIYRLETQDKLPLFKPVELSSERYVSQNQNLTNAAQSEEDLTFQELSQDLLFRTVSRVAGISGEKLKEEEARARKAMTMEQGQQSENAGEV